MTSFLDESPTPTHFEVLYYGEDRQMMSSEALFFEFSRGCFHFSKIYCKVKSTDGYFLLRLKTLAGERRLNADYLLCKLKTYQSI